MLSRLSTLAQELGFKEIAKGVLRRIFLPDLTWKLTFTLVSVGAAIVLFPAPFKVLFYNWIIATMNLNSDLIVTLPEMSNGVADYWMGFALILTGVFYNLLARLNQVFADHAAQLKVDSVATVDRKLFAEFLQDLPSQSDTMSFAEQHDFGYSFHIAATDRLDDFICKWRHPEYKFLDLQIEEEKQAVYAKAREFHNFICTKSSPISEMKQSVVPPGTTDFNWPRWLEEEVKLGNRLGSEFAAAHRAFISQARHKLTC